ncbi:MAG: hypothetical protein EP330_27675 [Deltaproteobacteria bacterium]|nr:MAG: hypothetical protein EP330_27675 [Deltaproteobacteria bacterium]
MFYQLIFLGRARRVQANVQRLADAGLVDRAPTLTQCAFGVLYMLHRIVRRPESIGIADAPERETWRARLLAKRPIRAPFLLASRTIRPWDLTGFASSPRFLRRHLVGTYHPGDNALYDLALLASFPGELEKLRAQVAEASAGETLRGRWLQDLCVYEGYHEHLAELVDRALAGDLEPRVEGLPTDATLRGYVDFLLAQPEDAGAVLRAWRDGELSAGVAA